MDRIYKPFYNNLMISNKGALHQPLVCCRLRATIAESASAWLQY